MSQNSDSEDICFQKQFKHNQSQPNLLSKSYIIDQFIFYDFPVRLLTLKKINGKKHFLELMKIEAEDTKYHQDWKIIMYKRYVKDGIKKYYIHVKCNQCKATIIYHQYQSFRWRLKYFRNNHIHIAKNFSSKAIQQEILKNFSLSNQEMYNILKEKYQINKTEFIKQKKSIMLNINFQKVRALLQSLGYQIKFMMNPQFQFMEHEAYPDILLAISSQQKVNYRHYGECVSFITYNCIKEVSLTDQKFVLGIFSGFDNNNRMLIFGFSVTILEKVKDYKILFKWFFDLMGFTHTTAFITDNNEKFVQALKELKQEENYNYYHLFDHEYFISTFRQSLDNLDQEIKKKLILKLKNVIMKCDSAGGQTGLKEISDMMCQYSLNSEYCMIQENLEKICLWKMPKKFVGLRLYSHEIMTYLAKMKIKSEVGIFEIIQKLDIISRERTQYSRSKEEYVVYEFENIFQNPRIKEVRDKFQRKVFNQFIYNYNRSQYYLIKQKNVTKKYYKITNILNSQIYQISNWRCQCGTNEKIGIICEHLIYICNTESSQKKYIDFILSRWLPLHQKNNNKAQSKIKKRLLR